MLFYINRGLETSDKVSKSSSNKETNWDLNSDLPDPGI